MKKNIKRKLMPTILSACMLTTTFLPMNMIQAKETENAAYKMEAIVTGSKSYEGYGPEKAYDGLCDDDNRWAANVTGKAELNFEFKQPITFTKLKVVESYREFYNRLAAVEVLISDNGKDYRSLKTFTGLRDNNPVRAEFLGNKSRDTVEHLKLDQSITTNYVKLILDGQDKEININEVLFVNEHLEENNPLKEQIKKAMNINVRDSKAQDVKALHEEIEKAKSVLNSESYTKEQETQAITNLEAAINKVKTSRLEGNLALHKEVTANSVYSEGDVVYYDYDQNKAVDGNFGTRWATEPKHGPFELIVDLGQETMFNQIVFYETDEFKGRLGQCKIEVSNDKNQWTSWYENKNVNTSIVSAVQTPNKYRYIKASFLLKDGNSQGLNIDEFAVYYDEKAITYNYDLKYTGEKATIDPNWIKPESSNKASIQQLRKQEMKYGMFIHYGVNTFTDNYWGFGDEEPSVFNPDPTTYNPEEWVKTAWEAGMNYIVLITKHHDGFALFDTQYSDYKVTNNGHPETNFDVVAKTAEACKKYGIKLGLYYSIWDQHWDNTHPLSNYTSQSERDHDYAIFANNQIDELMSNYGEVCELWIDGGWEKETSRWEYERIYDTVKRKNPNCQMSVNLTLGNTPIANLKGGEEIVNFPSDFKLYDGQDTSPNGDPKVFNYQGKEYYLPFEGTFIIGNEWFWNSHSRQDNMREKDPQKIVEWYNKYVNQKNTLVVNIPPSNKGVQTQHEINFIYDAANRLNIARGNARNNKDASESVVEIRYVTTDGSIAASTECLYGKAGEAYTVTPNAKLADLDYTLVKEPTNATGTFGNEKIVVEYVYNDDMLHTLDEADYSKVDAAIAKAEALTKEDYVDFTKVEEAIANVTRGLDVTKQSEVDAMAVAIETAIKNLEVKVAIEPMYMSATLNDKVSMNVYLAIDQSVLHDENAYVEFKVNDTTKRIAVKGLQANKDGLYKVSMPLYARQMSDDVTFLTHTAKQEQTYHYSIVEYANTVLAKKPTKEVKECVEAMLNYGANAQTYFQYHVENLANKGITNKEYETVTQEAFAPYAMQVSGEVAGMKYGACNLRLLSEVALRHHFKVTPAIKEAYQNGTMKVFLVLNDTEKELTPTFYDNDKMFVEVENIYAEDYDQTFRVEVRDLTNNTTLSVNASVFSYANEMFKKQDAKAETLDIVKAMYVYNKKAQAYKNSLTPEFDKGEEGTEIIK